MPLAAAFNFRGFSAELGAGKGEGSTEFAGGGDGGCGVIRITGDTGEHRVDRIGSVFIGNSIWGNV